MHVLVLAPNLPATSGMPGTPRLFSLCRELSRHHRLSLISFSDSSEHTEAFRDSPVTQQIFSDVTVLPPPPETTTWWRAQLHRLSGASHFAMRHRHPEYFREVCALVRKKCTESPAVDLVYADALKMSQYVALTDVPAVVDIHDSLTLLYRRASRLERNPLRRLIMIMESWGIGRMEKSLHRRFHTVITNSEVDSKVLRRMAPQTTVLTLQNGVDAEYFSAGSTPVSTRQAVFTGVMAYGPNEDAVVHFAQDIYPIIRGTLQDFEFFAVGHGAGTALRGLSRPGFHVTGTVPDVRPYIAAAPVFVCPLRYGSGMKNKVLAAMAMSRAVVTTRVGVEGIEVVDGHHVVVANTPAEFAKAVIRLLQHPDEARRMGENGRALVLEKYSWASRGAVLDAALRSVALTGFGHEVSQPERPFRAEEPPHVGAGASGNANGRRPS